RRLLRARKSGFSAQDIEDKVQDVLAAMLQFMKRHGPPDCQEALLVKIVRAARSDAVTPRQEERKLPPADPRAVLSDPHTALEEAIVIKKYKEIVFHVREYFRLKSAGCVPLADAKARGESLKDYAARLKQSYDKIRQEWSRCKQKIHDAMRQNRLRLDWPT